MESVFISSTFRDMHAERDILNLEVLPELNSKLQGYGKSVQFSDLRWGIDTTGLSDQDSMKKILSVCEDEINRCKPYIIVLLGDRYGTAITESLIHENVDISLIGKSVTHIEVLKGVFQNYDRNRIFIYFREIDYLTLPEEKIEVYKDSDEECICKLFELKNKLKEEFPDRVKEYQAKWNSAKESLEFENFEKIVYEDLYECFIGEIEDEISSKHLFHKKSFLNKCNQITESSYIAENVIEELHCKVLNSEMISLINGESGSGKTVLLSLLFNRMSKDNNAILFYFGLNEYSMYLKNMVEYLVFEIQDKIGEGDYKEGSEYTYLELIDKLSFFRDKLDATFYVYIDDLYHCDNVYLFGVFTRWCQFYFDGKIKFVCTIDDENVIRDIFGKNYNAIICDNSKSDVREIVNMILKTSKKSLSEEIIVKLVDKYRSPLLTQLLVTRLTMLKENDYATIDSYGGGINGINRYLEQLINSSSTTESDLLKEIIDVAFEEYETKQIIHILEYLTISEQGIRECDLRTLFKNNNWAWSDLVYASMHAKLSYVFTRNEAGVINFAHYSLKESFAPDEMSERIHDLMDLYYKSDDTDIWGAKEFFNYVIMDQSKEYFIKYILRNCNKENVIRGVAQDAIRKMVENGYSDFLFSSIKACKDISEQVLYVQLIKSSLILNRNFQDKQTIVNNVSLLLSLHDTITDYPQIIMYADYIECKKYLQRNNCMDIVNQLDNFYKTKFYELTDDEKSSTNINNNVEDNEKLAVLSLKLSMIQELKYQGNFHEIENVVFSIIEELKGIESGLLSLTLMGDCYKELGNALKMQKKWEEAIRCDQKSIDIYRSLKVERNDGFYDDIIRKKYRAGVYNIANTYESWALEEDTRELWEITESLFEKSYNEEIKALAGELSDQNVLYAFSTIFSYAVSKIKNDKLEESIKEFCNATKMIQDFSYTKESDSLYATVTMFQLDFILILLDEIEDRSIIDSIIEIMVNYVELVINDNNTQRNQQIMQAFATFDSKVNERIKKYFELQDYSKAAILCKYYCIIGRHFEKINDNARLFMQEVILCKNWADINYNALKNYDEVVIASEEMIRIIRDNNLLLLFMRIGSSEQIADFICTAMARIINSKNYLNKRESALEYVEDQKSNIAALAKFTDNFEKLPAYLVFSVARQIDNEECRRILANFAIDIATASEEELDNNKKIIIMCSELL